MMPSWHCLIAQMLKVSPWHIIFLNSFAQGVKEAHCSDVLFQLKFPLPFPNNSRPCMHDKTEHKRKYESSEGVAIVDK